MSGVVVTGAHSGIGLACAQVLVEQGRQVSLWDLQEGVEEQAASLGMTGVRVDVTDEAAVAAATIQAAETLGGIDGFVHAAGINIVAPLGALTTTSWDAVLDVNLGVRARRPGAAAPPARGHQPGDGRHQLHRGHRRQRRDSRVLRLQRRPARRDPLDGPPARP